MTLALENVVTGSIRCGLGGCNMGFSNKIKFRGESKTEIKFIPWRKMFPGLGATFS